MLCAVNVNTRKDKAGACEGMIEMLLENGQNPDQ